MCVFVCNPHSLLVLVRVLCVCSGETDGGESTKVQDNKEEGEKTQKAPQQNSLYLEGKALSS